MYTAVNIILDTRLKTEQILKFHIEKIESNFSVISGFFFFFLQQFLWLPSGFCIIGRITAASCVQKVSVWVPPLTVWVIVRVPPLSKWVSLHATKPLWGFQNVSISLSPLPIKMGMSASHLCRLSQCVGLPPTPAACLNLFVRLPPLSKHSAAAHFGAAVT